STINEYEKLYFPEDDEPPIGILGILDETSMLKPEWWLGYFSGSYHYPMIPETCAAEPLPAYPLTRDETRGELHVTGTVGGPSGFGVWLGPCIIDMSKYGGISFTVGGNAGSSAALEFKV